MPFTVLASAVEPAPDVVHDLSNQLTEALGSMTKDVFSMVGDLLTSTDIVPCILMAHCASLCVDCFCAWVDAKYPKRRRSR